jgi:biopolymer transport protein ExbD
MDVLEFLNKGGYSKVKLVTLEGAPGAAPPQGAPAAPATP